MTVKIIGSTYLQLFTRFTFIIPKSIMNVANILMEGCHNMLRIFICPKCYNFRIVSRNPDAICFHCGAKLHKSDLDYVEFIDMNEQERMKYKENFIKRMKTFQNEVDSILVEQEVNKLG